MLIRAQLRYTGYRLNHFLKKKKPFSGKAILLKLAKKLVGKPKEKITVKTLHGFKILVDPVNDHGVEQSIFETGTYEFGTLEIFKKILRPGDTFIDAGANIGLMSLYASRIVGTTGRIHAFEPNPSTFKMLEYNCRINKIKNIQLNDQGLGATHSSGYLAENMHINRGAASLINGNKTNGSLVQIDTLDHYAAKHHIQNIRLIKADVEGYEWEMLKGAKNILSGHNMPMLCVEFSNGLLPKSDATDLYDFLKEQTGYKIFKPENWKGDAGLLVEVKDFDSLPKHDNIFCFLPAHLAELDAGIFYEWTRN